MSITYTVYNSNGEFHGVVNETGNVKSNIPEDGFAVDGEQHSLSTCIGGTLVVPSDAAIEADSSAKALEILRQERNERLAATDWTQANDSPLSDSKKIEWASYRQILRDLPANTSDPLNASYPDKPE